MRHSTAIVLSVILSVMMGIMCQARPAIECPLIDTAPVIDGVLDDAVWQQAGVSDHLVDYQTGVPGEPQTRFHIYTDGLWLYIAVDLADEHAAQLSRENLGRDKADWRENIEVFLAPDVHESTYYHFAVNPGGGDYDNREMGSASDNNYHWKHAEHIADDRWTAEIALLLSDLGRPRLNPGDMLNLNINRANEHGSVTHQAWSPTGSSFHNRSAFGTVVVGSFAQAARSDLAALSAQFNSLRAELDESEETAAKAVKALQLSFNRLESDLTQMHDDIAWQAFSQLADKVRREMTRLAYADAGVVIWEVTPWHLPAATTLPLADTPLLQTMNLTALQGEYVTVALAVANVTDDVMEVRCFPTGLVSPTWLEHNPVRDVVSVHQALTIALSGNNHYRDPLPELNPATPLCLAPGRNGIIWLTINTHTIKPGRWMGNLQIKPLVQLDLARTIPLNLTVLPVDMPMGPRPYSGNWPHHERDIFKHIADECRADQKAHYTNMHTHCPKVLRTITFDDQGSIASGPDFSQLQALIDVYGTEGQLYLIPDWYIWLPKELAGGGSWGEKQQENFTWAVREVRNFFESKGMSVNDFAWYAHDEPSTVETATAVANFGKLMQAADPQQQIFVTVYSKVPLDVLEIMAPYVNLWCPSLGLTSQQREFITSLPDARLLSYTVNPRSSDSYWTYRLAAMKAYDFGYEGIGFWCYDDASMSVWDDTDGDGVDYAVVYESPDGPVSSVRWEAWRHGIQDFRFLDWLTQLAQSCPDTDLSRQALDLVQTILNDNLNNPDKRTADKNNILARQMGIDLLCRAGQADAEVIAQLSEPLPVCLTGNAGEFGLSLDTGGAYYYNQYPSPDTRGERCAVVEGPVYFKANHAVSPPQTSNQFDGALTDGLLRYPDYYTIHWWPPQIWSITFDLNTTAALTHALFYTFEFDGKIDVSVSDTADGPWKQVAVLDDIPHAQKCFEGSLFIDLKATQGRWVKFDIHTGGKGMRIGEIRIFGKQ